MKVKDLLLEKGIDPANADFSDVFALTSKSDTFELVKEEISTDLLSLIGYTKTTRTELAERINAGKSRITRIFSGAENLTIRSIYQLCSAVGYEFDIIFRKKGETKPLQPWQTASIHIDFESTQYWKGFSSHNTVRTQSLLVKAPIQHAANDSNWKNLATSP